MPISNYLCEIALCVCVCSSAVYIVWFYSHNELLLVPHLDKLVYTRVLKTFRSFAVRLILTFFNTVLMLLLSHCNIHDVSETSSLFSFAN
jgi:hypothetical protein